MEPQLITEGHHGYEDVRFRIETESEDEGDVEFYVIEDEEAVEAFVNEGYWGPEEGFDVDADYEETTTWGLIFTEEGDYEITFSLIDAEDEEVVNDTENSVEVTAELEPAFFDIGWLNFDPGRELYQGDDLTVTVEVHGCIK